MLILCLFEFFFLDFRGIAPPYLQVESFSLNAKFSTSSVFFKILVQNSCCNMVFSPIAWFFTDIHYCKNAMKPYFSPFYLGAKISTFYKRRKTFTKFFCVETKT